MDKALTFLLFCLFTPQGILAPILQKPPSVASGPTIVQSCEAGWAATCTLSNTVTGNSVGCLDWNTGADATSWVTTSVTLTNSVTQQAAANTSQKPAFWFMSNITGQATETIHSSGGGGTGRYICAEFHKASGSPVFDAFGNGSGASTASVTTTGADLILNELNSQSSGNATQITGWTLLSIGNPEAPNFFFSAGYQSQSVAGTYSLTPAGTADIFLVSLK